MTDTDFQAGLEADLLAAAKAKAANANAVTSGGGRPSVYKTADGKRVPGVTTILGKFKEPGALMAWAHKLGLEGIDFRKARDDAGDAGTLAHTWIDDEIHGRPMTRPGGATDETCTLAQQGLDAFRRWRDGVKLEILDTERPLVSEQFRFGGTFDALGIANGEKVVLDWKSSNRVYREHVAQCAAYRQLLREHGHPDVTGARLLRVGKESATFSDHYFPDSVLDIGWSRFMASLALYLTDATLAKATGL